MPAPSSLALAHSSFPITTISIATEATTAESPQATLRSIHQVSLGRRGHPGLGQPEPGTSRRKPSENQSPDSESIVAGVAVVACS